MKASEGSIFRVDAINVFNIPNFYFNSRGNTPFGFGTFPIEFPGTECIANVSIPTPTTANCPGGTRTSVISAGEYDPWAPSTVSPVKHAAGAAILGQIRTMINTAQAPTASRSTGQAAERCQTTSSPLQSRKVSRQPIH